ncbi:hypothetical protein [Modicisalibacter luteus]|uniref:Uncharacterized protein n=1 Tax=Modicisalibacter luteus TaxID=453962 RepID=A0ABV7M3B4_9GAMM|nr:hypothetical protein [Halomonas lutea]GHA86219.1 hypothetical protein GCM10007159_04230 [Halomonas lutea]
MTDEKHLIENVDAILGVAKQIKAGKGRYQRTLEQEQSARDSVKALQREAHATTTAMVNDEDMSKHRALSDIQKDLLKAHNKVDKAIDKSHDDAAAMKNYCKRLQALVRGADAENSDESKQDGTLDK